MPVDVPVNPPAGWFTPPEVIPTDTRIVIQADGRVYGYVALWNTCHAGIPGCTRPPKGSPTDYEYSHQGETMTQEGELVRTAVIAGGTGHAPVNKENALVPAFYENTGTQLMRVRYGEDQNGLWFAGALWPDVSELDIARIRASSVSGDWRWHAAWRHTAAGYDFAGSCLVNIPGYPMPTADGQIGGRAGQMQSLAASLAGSWIVTDGSEWIATNNEQPIAASLNGDTEVCDCDCKKGGKAQEDDTTDEQLIENLVASMTEIVDRKRGKKVISADGSDTNSGNELAEVLKEIVGRLDRIEGNELARELTAAE